MTSITGTPWTTDTVLGQWQGCTYVYVQIVSANGMIKTIEVK